MIIYILLVLLGFGLLIKGADWLVTGSSALAKKHHVSDLVIGLTIVAFGTSMPELVVNGIASFQKHSDIVYGNIIGSNVFNIFVILGLTAVIYPITVKSSMVKKEIPFSLFLLLVVFFLSNSFLWQEEAVLSRADAAVLFLLLVIFGYFVFKQSKNEVLTEEVEVPTVFSNVKIWGFILLGLVALVAGGQLVVSNAVNIAQKWGISEKIIGLTIIAAGTSLPELVTSVVAASKKKSDIAIGNVIGSNVLNILLILSISGFINPIPFNPKFNTELLLLGLGTVLVIVFTFTSQKNKLDRWEGMLLFGIFIAYTVYLIQNEM